MNHLSSIDIEVISQRDAGSLYQYVFWISQEGLKVKIRSIIELPIPHFEFSVPDPSNLDCSLEVKVLNGCFQTKKGCHGAYGTWRDSNLHDAIQWLMPGAEYAAQHVKSGYGFILNVYK